ncbi:MAG: hypothetical protein P4L40_15760 [Terracidiphilus sp.]|nr:hypothetical protein [Terracidiphilus sp.]
MTRGLKTICFLSGAALLALVCAFTPNPAAPLKTDVLVTAAPVYEPLAALSGGERFPKGAQIERLHAGKAEPLVAGFAATADANVSFDAKTVLFAGKRTASDVWQIWELTLASGAVRQLTHGTTDAIRPFYLPAGRFLYAGRGAHGFQLLSARMNDDDKFLDPALPETFALTYMQASAVPDDVLADGRILFESGFPLGTAGSPELYLVYADGSGVESYRCDHGTARWEGRQLASGDVIFTHGATLGRFTSPLAHEGAVAAPKAEYAGAVAELAAGTWLVSARATQADAFAVKLWKSENSTLAPVFAERGMNLVEPVMIEPHQRPKHHPSALHPWDYANLLALDARLSREGALNGVPAAVRVETQDAAGNAKVMGTAPVEEDGSFFVKVPGDTPVRFAVLNATGKVLRAERGWFWSRGGEQRICTGCHTGPERAAENRAPAVLLRTTIPTDLTGKTDANGGLSK